MTVYNVLIPVVELVEADSAQEALDRWIGVTTYIVVRNPGGRRVSVHAHHTRQGAQLNADDLNILDMVSPHIDDPRPFGVRRAEAETKYRAERNLQTP